MQAPMQVSLLGPHSHVSMELRGGGEGQDGVCADTYAVLSPGN